MRILGIETSCDETAAAIVEDGKHVVSESLASSQKLHTKTGGIIPEQAARKQVQSIIPVVSEVLSSAKTSEIDAIAVTIGPGLIGSLLVGVETAKTLAAVWSVPIIPVNHLHGHLFSSWIGTSAVPTFPLVGLVISGGHTDIVYMERKDSIKLIGGTRDDAAGEAFDKTARLIGLPYPGGPAISELAQEYRSKNPNTAFNLFPRPMINSADLDMSFSGLKTAVSNYVTNTKPDLSDNECVSGLAAEIESAVVDVIVAKAKAAVEKYHPASIVAGGGVVANRLLRDELSVALTDYPETSLFLPIAHNTDNAVMIATAAYHTGKPKPASELTAIPQLSVEITP